jgi:hypothetical protein
MAVYPTSFALQMGLGGGFRRTLINESFVVGVWPLSELGSDRARDITGNNNHGTYTGSGFTRGITLDVAEGGLGTTFDGNGYIVVADDGLSSGLNLSLAAGSVDIVFLMKTSTNDATNRAIVQKMATDATGNGYSVSLQSGAIRFRIEVSGSELFNFTRGAVSDNAWHLIHCFYDPATQEARTFIDGVQSGATVATGTTEPLHVAVDLRIGSWTDGSGKFIGTLAYVMVGREGNLTLAASLQAARIWTAVSADVRGVQPIQWRYGISGSGILDNVARPGVLSFALNNATTNTGSLLGYYSPGHANCRSGFEIGAPVRFSVTYGGVTYYKFRGRMISARPLPGQYRERYTLVTCADWMDVAANVVVSALEAQISQRSDAVLKVVLDQTEGRSPAAVDISVGSSTFPFALDLAQGEEESILTEITRVTGSERGFAYIKGDITQGGTFRWEGRGDRQIATTLDATFSNTMHGLEVDYSLNSLVNIVRVVVTPRRVDAAATTVLYELEVSNQSVQIVPGQTLVLEGGYRDPNQEAQRVGGTAMVEPVAGTDYAFWSNSDGSGADLTSSLTIFTDGGRWLGGNSFKVEITNNGSTTGFLRLSSAIAFQIRGKGIYHYTPVTVERRNDDSVRKYGPRTVQIDLPYESSTSVGSDIADFVLNILGTQRPIPKSLSLLANNSNALMIQALVREPGDKVGLSETVTGITTDDPDTDNDVGYFINEVSGTYEPGGILRTSWTLAPAAPTGVWVFDESTFDETTVWGF